MRAKPTGGLGLSKKTETLQSIKQKTQNFSCDSGFEMIKGPQTLNGWLYKGYGTGETVDEDYVIIACKDEETLQRVCNKLGFKNPKIKSNCTVGAYSWMEKKEEEPKPRDTKVYWFYSSAKHEIRLFHGYEKTEGYVNMGEMKRGTEQEAKIILRDKELDFRTAHIDLIPF